MVLVLHLLPQLTRFQEGIACGRSKGLGYLGLQVAHELFKLRLAQFSLELDWVEFSSQHYVFLAMQANPAVPVDFNLFFLFNWVIILSIQSAHFLYQAHDPLTFSILQVHENSRWLCLWVILTLYPLHDVLPYSCCAPFL